MEENKKVSLNPELNTIEDCENLIKQAHWFLIILAGLMLILGTLLGQFINILPDILFMVIIALLLNKYKSRSISIFIFIYSLLICIVTFGNKLHIKFFETFSGGTNIFLAILFVYVAFKTVQAAFKLYKLKNYSISWKNFFIKSLIFLILFFIFLFIVLICTIFINNYTILGLLVYIAFLLPMYIAFAGLFPMSDKLKIKYVKEKPLEDNMLLQE